MSKVQDNVIYKYNHKERTFYRKQGEGGSWFPLYFIGGQVEDIKLDLKETKSLITTTYQDNFDNYTIKVWEHTKGNLNFWFYDPNNYQLDQYQVYYAKADKNKDLYFELDPLLHLLRDGEWARQQDYHYDFNPAIGKFIFDEMIGLKETIKNQEAPIVMLPAERGWTLMPWANTGWNTVGIELFEEKPDVINMKWIKADFFKMECWREMLEPALVIANIPMFELPTSQATKPEKNPRKLWLENIFKVFGKYPLIIRGAPNFLFWALRNNENWPKPDKIIKLPKAVNFRYEPFNTVLYCFNGVNIGEWKPEYDKLETKYRNYDNKLR